MIIWSIFTCHNETCRPPVSQVPGRSANTEKEEAMFTSLKTYRILLKHNKLTSNFHSDQLVSNIIIQLQVREILNNGNDAIYRSIKVTLHNSIILFECVRKCSNKYQRLLEEQVGFLLDSSYW